MLNAIGAVLTKVCSPGEREVVLANRVNNRVFFVDFSVSEGFFFSKGLTVLLRLFSVAVSMLHYTWFESLFL